MPSFLTMAVLPFRLLPGLPGVVAGQWDPESDAAKTLFSFLHYCTSRSETCLLTGQTALNCTLIPLGSGGCECGCGCRGEGAGAKKPPEQDTLT